MRKGSRSKKKRITRGDVFVEKATRQVVRVMAASKAHKNFGDVLGTIIVRPFDEDGEWLTLRSGNDVDQTISERDYAFVRPSNISVIRGDLKKAGGLTIGVDVDHALSLLAMQKGARARVPRRRWLGQQQPGRIDEQPPYVRR